MKVLSLKWWFGTPKDLKLGFFWRLVATIGKGVVAFGGTGFVLGATIVVTSTTGEDTPAILGAAIGMVLAAIITFIGRGIEEVAYHMAARHASG